MRNGGVIHPSVTVLRKFEPKLYAALKLLHSDWSPKVMRLLNILQPSSIYIKIFFFWYFSDNGGFNV